MSTVSSLCPHCHEPVTLYRDGVPVTDPRYCPTCGHNPRLSRMDCDCQACQPPPRATRPLPYDPMVSGERRFVVGETWS